MWAQMIAFCSVACVAAGAAPAGDIQVDDEADRGAAEFEQLSVTDETEDVGLLPTDTAAYDSLEGIYTRPMRDPVDINTTAFVTLAHLPSLGPRDAQAIIAGRPYDVLEELTARHILDAAQLDAIAPLVYVDRGKVPWQSQAQSRTWWQSNDNVASGLSATTSAAGFRVGAAAAARAMRERLSAKQTPKDLKVGNVTLHDAFVQQTTGAHAWVLGYYDIGFAERLTFDSTTRPAPDGIQRGMASWAARPPKLLGGAYTWQQHAARGEGITGTAFAATHPLFPQLAGARLAYGLNPRTLFGIMGYAAHAQADPASTSIRPKKAANFSAIGVAATLGWGPCDVASEGAVAARGLAYSLSGVCEPKKGWQVGATWRDVDADFNHPFFRSEAGRAVPNRRMVGTWARLRMPGWQTSARADVSWPHGADEATAQVRSAGYPQPAWSMRHQWAMVPRPRHTLRTRAGSRKSKVPESPWNHSLALSWIYGARYGWSTEVAMAWQKIPLSTNPAHLTATFRIGWRQPKLLLGAGGITGLDAPHWRAGFLAGYRFSSSVILSLRLHCGRKAASQPVHHAGLLVATTVF